MFPFTFTVNAKPWSSSMKADNSSLEFAAAVGLTVFHDEHKLALDTPIRIDFHDAFDQGGTVTVENALRWALSPQGTEALSEEGIAIYDLETLAGKLGFK